jgi:hypothetical protein
MDGLKKLSRHGSTELCCGVINIFHQFYIHFFLHYDNLEVRKHFTMDGILALCHSLFESQFSLSQWYIK